MSTSKLKSAKTIVTAAIVVLVLLILFTMKNIRSDDPGMVLYSMHCQSCHMENGEGLANLIPPLNSQRLGILQNELACIIWNGRGEYSHSHAMPSNEDLTPGQIMNIINYINHSWSNDYKSLTLRQIREQLAGCEK